MNLRTFTPVYLIFAITLFACADNKTENGNAEEKAEVPTSVSDTINQPALVKAGGDGSLHLTAENGRGIGPEIKYMPEWRAFGWFTAADSVEWEVQVPSTGAYQVQLEWSVSDEEAGKEFILVAGPEQLTGKVEKSGSWETFRTKNLGRIKLNEGTQKIVFRSVTKFDDGALLDLRKITLTRE